MHFIRFGATLPTPHISPPFPPYHLFSPPCLVAREVTQQVCGGACGAGGAGAGAVVCCGGWECLPFRFSTKRPSIVYACDLCLGVRVCECVLCPFSVGCAELVLARSVAPHIPTGPTNDSVIPPNHSSAPLPPCHRNPSCFLLFHLIQRSGRRKQPPSPWFLVFACALLVELQQDTERRVKRGTR